MQIPLCKFESIKSMKLIIFRIDLTENKNIYLKIKL